MRLMPIALTALAAQTAAKKVIRPCQDSKDITSGVVSHPAALDVFTGMFPEHAQTYLAARGNNDPFAALGMQGGQCLDVAGGALVNKAKVQSWQCTNGPNQKWRFEGPLVQTGNDLCLDVPNGKGGLGTSLQVYKCNGQNPNQQFERVGSNIRWYGHNLCLDVKDGLFKNGGGIQLWACYFSSANQAFIMGGQAQAVTPATTNAGNFLGYDMISWTAFVNRHPVISSYASGFPQAAAQYKLVPQLLGSIALQESSGNCNPSNGGGLAQFTSLQSWAAFGSGSRSNCYDAIWGMAKYMRFLLDAHNQNLDAALREYNGDVANGGNADYMNMIRRWMRGEYVYGSGT